MKVFWVSTGLALMLASAMVIGTLAIFQENILFQTTPAAEASPSFHLDRPYQEILLPVHTNGKTLKIDSIYIPTTGAKSLILYFHGNAGNLQDWATVASEIGRRVQASIWIMDYPGYGSSEGFIEDEMQLEQMATAFLVAAPERGVFENLVVYGRSLGSGLAAYLAGHFPDQISGVVLETPFLNLTKVVHDHAPWFPSVLLRYRFENEKALLNYPGPILIFHGTKDDVISSAHSDELAESLASRGSVSYVEIPGGQHNNLFEYPNYSASLINWFKDLEFENQNPPE